MKSTLLITALTLTLISSFSAQAANRTAVAAPAVAVQASEVKTLDLEQITTQVSPEMRAALEEIKAQALEQAKGGWNASPSIKNRMGSGKVSMQDFHFSSEARAVKGYAVKALEGGGYEVSNPSSGEKIKISIGISFKPLTITVSAEF